MDDNQVFIVLVNYNTHLDTIECLESIYKNIKNRFQVIVIDNSEELSEILEIKAWAEGKRHKMIRTSFSHFIEPTVVKPLSYIIVDQEKFYKNNYEEPLILVKSSQNKGFAAANNIGLLYIKQFGNTQDIVWLLNNDTVVSPDSINRLLKELEKQRQNRKNTLYGTPLLEYYQPDIIQAIGGVYNKTFGISTHKGSGHSLNTVMDISDFKVDYPIGASMLCFNEFLQEVGLMNEEYFLFFEELDWIQRAKTVGGGTKILPVFEVYHKQGKSTLSEEGKTKSEFIDLLSLRNRILFSRKFYKKQVCTVKLFILTLTIFKRIISGNFNRIPKIIKLVFTT